MPKSYARSFLVLLVASLALTRPLLAKTRRLSPGAIAILSLGNRLYKLGNKTPQDNRLGQGPASPLQWEKFQQEYGGIVTAGRKLLKLPYRYPAWEPGQPWENTALDRSGRMLATLFVRDADLRMARGERGRAAQGYLDAMDLGSRWPRGGAMLAAQTGQWAFDIGWVRLDTAVAEFDAPTCEAILKRLQVIETTRPRVDEILREEDRRGGLPAGQFVLPYVPPSKAALDFALRVWQLPRHAPSPVIGGKTMTLGEKDYFRTLYLFDGQQLEFDTLRVRLVLRLYSQERTVPPDAGGTPQTLPPPNPSRSIRRRRAPALPLRRRQLPFVERGLGWNR